MADAYMDWLLTPKELREPSTQKAFAELWGVSEETLRNRRKETGFQRDMIEKARSLVKLDKLPDIIEALYQTAMSKSPQQVAAAKLLIDFQEKATLTAPFDPSKLTTDELKQLAAAALSTLTADA